MSEKFGVSRWKLLYTGWIENRVQLHSTVDYTQYSIKPKLEKTLMLGGIGGRRRRGQQRIRGLDGITDSMNMSLGKSGSW